MDLRLCGVRCPENVGLASLPHAASLSVLAVSLPRNPWAIPRRATTVARLRRSCQSEGEERGQKRRAVEMDRRRRSTPTERLVCPESSAR